MDLIVQTFVTLDGVMQGPGGADEDRSDGFDQGGWLPPFVDDDFGEIVDAWMRRAGEFLLGRRTYELMYPYWSQVTDPDEVVAQMLNNLPKHIASRTLRAPEWANSQVIDGDVVEAVTALKDKPGGELQVHGSAGLMQTLNRHHLVDEYRLLVFPVVLGTGKRLFESGAAPTALRLVECKPMGKGTVLAIYHPVGKPSYGEFQMEEGYGLPES